MQSNHSPMPNHQDATNDTPRASSISFNVRPISPRRLRSSTEPTPAVNGKNSNHNGHLNSTETISEKMKRATIGTDPTNNDDLILIPEHSADTNHRAVSTPQQAKYSKMLNLTPDLGSIEEGERLFDVLLRPLQGRTFIEKYWEQQPLRLDRKCPEFYTDLLSSKVIDQMLRQNQVEFTKHIEVQCFNGTEVVTPAGRAFPPTFWEKYASGCEIKISNPQMFLPTIHSMNATLQEYFQCKIESTVYLASKEYDGCPPPRYDNVETFILQIEGKRHWRVYKPTHKNNILSSESKYVEVTEDIGTPDLDVMLSAGDLLYYPRGYVHEMTPEAESHSLYLALKLYAKQTYGDLLAILLPMAVKAAINDNLKMRKGLPLNIWQNMGLVNSDNLFGERDTMIDEIRDCLELIDKYVVADMVVDNAVDEMAGRFQHNALPPTLTPDEELRSVSGRNVAYRSDGPEYVHIGLDTKIRLVRANVVRIASDDIDIRVLYSSENSKDHQGHKQNFLDIDPLDVSAVEVLMRVYPSYIKVRDLQLRNDDQNLFVAQELWKRRVILTQNPLI